MATNTHEPFSSSHANSPDTNTNTNTCMHGLESHTNMEIIDELRRARARVRFLKKKLRQRGVSSKMKKCSRHQHSFCISPDPTDLLMTPVPLAEDSIRVRETFLGETNSREKVTVRRIKGRKDGISKPEHLPKIENSEGGKCVQGSVDSAMVTHGKSSESRTWTEMGLERKEEDPLDKTENSESNQDSKDLLNYCNTSQYNVIAPTSNLWQCFLQGPEGPCSNECSSMEGLVSESSTHLQDDPFSSKRHALMDAIYSQSSAAALAKPGNGLCYLQSGAGYFTKCGFEQEFSDGLGVTFPEQGLMDSNLAAESALHDLDLLLHQNPAVESHEYLSCQHLSLQNFGEHSVETQPCQCHQHHEADLLDSSYLESKKMEHQNLAETSSKLCGSDLLLHHPRVMHSRYDAVGFEYEYPRACVQALADIGGSTSREETWKTVPSEEQRSMEAANLWAEDQIILQDETFSLDSFDFTSLNQ